MRRAQAARRIRRLAIAVVLGAVFLVTLLLTAFDSSGGSTAARPAPAASLRVGTAAPPEPLVIAQQGALRLQLPISQALVTAIAYHGPGDGALALAPAGRQANEGVFGRIGRKLFGGDGSGLPYYQLGGEGPATGALDIGAPAGTDVYSPVDGSVVAISPYILDGRRYGSQIDIAPTDTPSVVVSLTRLRGDPALNVGSIVVSGRSKIGTVIDLSAVERQALARYTRDAGNHVTAEVRPAATAGLN